MANWPRGFLRWILSGCTKERSAGEGVLSMSNSSSKPSSDTAAEIELDPDRPIVDPSKDRLGFAQIADKLAVSILGVAAKDGLVIGIEGRWGSGKSSLLELMCRKVSQQTSSASVIRFSPWIVGDRDAMVVSLMNQIAMAVEHLKERSAIEEAAALGPVYKLIDA